MLNRNVRILPLTLVAVAALFLSGCGQYVKQADFDATVSQLRGEIQSSNQQLQQQIDDLRSNLERRLVEHDARLTEMEGRIQVDNIVYFEFDQTELQSQYQAGLDAFAKVMREHHGNALVTVEGFTDPAGSAGYNQRLGQKRADAVRDYLVTQGGLSSDHVRAVSYGKDSKRVIDAGKTHEDGRNNRRAVLVVDFTG